MSRTNIFLILVVAVLMGSLFSVFVNNYESVVFARAFSEPGIEFKVSGTLDTLNPIVYNPKVSASQTRFHMRDKEGEVREVILNKPEPQGLKNSESINITGSVIDGQFIAREMQMKCPSKYNEQSRSLADASNAP